MRIIVAGSRKFHDYNLLKSSLDRIITDKVEEFGVVAIEIVSGLAAGPDILGVCYAKDNGYIINCYPAYWHKHGNKAGYIRNKEMSENADILIAFWDNRSRGTKMMIDLAIQRGLITYVVDVEPDSSNWGKIYKK